MPMTNKQYAALIEDAVAKAAAQLGQVDETAQQEAKTLEAADMSKMTPDERLAHERAIFSNPNTVLGGLYRR